MASVFTVWLTISSTVYVHHSRIGFHGQNPCSVATRKRYIAWFCKQTSASSCISFSACGYPFLCSVKRLEHTWKRFRNVTSTFWLNFHCLSRVIPHLFTPPDCLTKTFHLSSISLCCTESYAYFHHNDILPAVHHVNCAFWKIRP